MKKVFISSTVLDLEKYREEVKSVIEQLGLFAIDMKNFGNRSEEPKEVCFQQIEQCDIMIGIYAHRYGYIPPNENDKKISITELEYNYAREKEKKVICYIIDDETTWLPKFIDNNAKAKKLKKFKEKISMQKTSSNKFKNEENLGKLVNIDLTREIQIAPPNHSEEIINQYLKKISSIYSKFDTLSGKVTDMKMNQFDLYDIYLPVTLSPEKNIDDSLNNYSIEFLAGNQANGKNLKDYNLEKQKEYEEEQSQSIGFFLKKAKKIVVLGSAGQGKTILCNWMLTGFSDKRVNTEKFEKLEDSKTVQDLALLPIIIKCRSIGKYDFPNTLEGIIRIALKDNQFDSDFTEDFIKTINHSLAKEELLIVVDGLDEIDTVENLGKFSEFIQDLSNKLPHCYFVLTSRLNSYKEVEHKVGAGFKNIVVDELDVKKQEKLIEKFSKIYNLPNDTTHKILESFDNKHTETFIKTPLILTNICLIYQKEGFVPKRIDELYESVLKLMFSRVVTQNRLPNCSDNELRRLLAWLAYELCKENKDEFSDREFKKIIKEFKEKNDLTESYFDNPNQILDYLCQKVNIFNNVGFQKVRADYHHFYEFRHRSYKEFLAGVSLASVNNSSVNEEDDFVSVINKHLKEFDPASVTYENRKVNYLKVSENWIEPIKFALMLSDKKDSTAFLESLITQNASYTQLEYEARVALAATVLTDIQDKGYEEIAIKVVSSLALCLNDEDDLYYTGNTIRSILFMNKLSNSIWNEIVLHTLLNLYINQYEDNYCFEKVFSVILTYLEHSLLDINSLEIQTDREKIIYSANILMRAFRNNFDINHLESAKNNLLHFVNSKHIGVALASAWALLWIAKAGNIEDGIWLPSESEIMRIESLLIKSSSDNVDGYLIPILMKAKGYLRDTIIEGENILFNKIGIINYEIKDKLLLDIINKKIETNTSDYNLWGLYSSHIRLSYLNVSTAIFHLKNVEKLNPKRFVNEVIPYLIKLNSVEIFEELFKLLTHENKNIVEYSKLVFTRISNEDKIPFLSERREKCTSETKQIIDEIIANTNSGYITDFIVKSSGHLIHKLKAKDTTGRWAYYFVLVNSGNEKEFLKAIEGDGTIDLEDFGQVVASCYGETPSQEVKDYLKNKYDFDV
jgi:hypothetical protein